MNRMEDQLGALFAEYREACPDREGGPDFMPRLWRKIEARRQETTSIFRRLAQICVGAAVVLTLLGAALMPTSPANEVFYQGSYVDILAADHANDYVSMLQVDVP